MVLTFEYPGWSDASETTVLARRPGDEKPVALKLTPGAPVTMRLRQPASAVPRTLRLEATSDFPLAAPDTRRRAGRLTGTSPGTLTGTARAASSGVRTSSACERGHQSSRPNSASPVASSDAHRSVPVPSTIVPPLKKRPVKAAGGIDEDVDGAPVVEHGLDHRFDDGRPGNVGFDRDRRRADLSVDAVRSGLVEGGGTARSVVFSE